MKTLFVNAAFREASRSYRLAKAYLEKYHKEGYETVDLGTVAISPLRQQSLKVYNEAVAAHDYSDPMFDFGKQFREMDEIVVAAPFWNYHMPAVLHDYFEMVCSQGITFDIDDKGVYHSLCKAKRMTYITTAGGAIPDDDPAFGYIKVLCDVFFQIPDTRCIKAERLDVYGTDVEKILSDTIKAM
ncbi:MAG: NAD(P)H-dependent oxidoreductase [Lachnospiraceae bacterium]|nr:NAD(P)H-dependent oxidoreductase [Lachnospiraceae bacterium]